MSIPATDNPTRYEDWFFELDQLCRAAGAETWNTKLNLPHLFFQGLTPAQVAAFVLPHDDDFPQPDDPVSLLSQSSEQGPMDSEQDPVDWQQFAREAWQVQSVEDEDKRLAAERERADKIIALLAGFDPPILGAQARGDMAEADGVLFALANSYHDLNGSGPLIILGTCEACGQTVRSRRLDSWAMLGAVLSISPLAAMQLESMDDLRLLWAYHRCPEPDPADLVAVLRHLLLFVYDRETGAPVLPLYAINRAEEALAAFGKEDAHG